MKTIDIRQAKEQLSTLVESAARGESFIIATEGKPMVRVCAIDSVNEGRAQRIGFLKGRIQVPDDFDEMGSDQ